VHEEAKHVDPNQAEEEEEESDDGEPKISFNQTCKNHNG
jgi:Fe2+ transport system protein B